MLQRETDYKWRGNVAFTGLGEKLLLGRKVIANFLFLGGDYWPAAVSGFLFATSTISRLRPNF